jgi:hypothetical protein
VPGGETNQKTAHGGLEEQPRLAGLLAWLVGEESFGQKEMLGDGGALQKDKMRRLRIMPCNDTIR